MTEYILTVSDYSFKVVHTIFDKEDDYETLDIGYLKEEGWCIEFTYQPISEPSIIKMKNVTHNRKCSIEENLENGIGTRMMVKAAIVLAFKVFSKATRIYFHDVSEIYYHTNKKIAIDLPILKMIQEGTTWYEKNFHAKPVDDWSEAKKKIAQKKDFFQNLTLRDFAIHGSAYWKMVSPDKNIVHSEWYIERGANRIAFQLEKQKKCKQFKGGYWMNGMVLDPIKRENKIIVLK